MIFRRYYFVLLTVSVAIRSIASEDSPYSSSSSYAPKLLPCPSNFQVRQIGTPRSRKQDLAPQEATYIASRRSKVIPEAYDTYLRNVERYLSSFNRSDAKLPSYVSKILSSKNQTTLPRMSLAVAGGAYRGISKDIYIHTSYRLSQNMYTVLILMMDILKVRFMVPRS